ncbi:Sodium:solute symporter family-domain-containing protein [Jimgerdemannia flammicorona]|uniref:Sodium:solute symporter family-domain-containing protein n=1 Tax=Jimgerdemannia flammicorona TaxID=994334 RepID=A0A433DGI3_9FUNG|nr:Sodium:solute symporter family-domain-containing protein [Jimgerdemannia flammicorona]
MPTSLNFNPRQTTLSLQLLITMALTPAVSNTLIYVTFAIFFCVGIYAGVRARGKRQDKQDWLGATRSQTAWPLGANWFAANMGVWILFSLPEIATITGLQGVIVYTFACVVPIPIFAWLGPMIRRKSPKGFTLTAYMLKRFNRVLHAFISIMSVIYMACYMVSELSALGQTLNLLTGLDPLAPIIVVSLLTSIYTAYGGFRASLLTDTVQGWCLLFIVIISAIAIVTNIRIGPDQISAQPWILQGSKKGWEQLYILPVAVTFSNFFHQGFWQRAFASKTDKDLRQSAIIGSTMLFPVLFFIGFTGIIAAWAGIWPGPDPAAPVPGSLSFFSIIAILPDWLVGVVVVLTAALVCSSIDTLQSALVSTLSNDVFNNQLPLHFIRVIGVVINAPIIYMAARQLDIFQVFLIGDLLACVAITPAMLGLYDGFYFLNAYDALIGAIFGLFSVFAFGSGYYNDAQKGINLILLPGGLYVEDESVLGAFIAAPFGAAIATFLSFGSRQACIFLYCKVRGQEYEFPPKPEIDATLYAGDEFHTEDERQQTEADIHKAFDQKKIKKDEEEVDLEVATDKSRADVATATVPRSAHINSSAAPWNPPPCETLLFVRHGGPAVPRSRSKSGTGMRNAAASGAVPSGAVPSVRVPSSNSVVSSLGQRYCTSHYSLPLRRWPSQGSQLGAEMIPSLPYLGSRCSELEAESSDHSAFVVRFNV